MQTFIYSFFLITPLRDRFVNIPVLQSKETEAQKVLSNLNKVSHILHSRGRAQHIWILFHFNIFNKKHSIQLNELLKVGT